MSRLLTAILLAATVVTAPALAQNQSSASAGIDNSIIWSQIPFNSTDHSNYPTLNFTSLQNDTTVRYFADVNAVPQELKQSSGSALNTYLPVGQNGSMAQSSNLWNSTSVWTDKGLMYSTATTKITFVAGNGDTEFWMPLFATASAANGGWAQANVTVTGAVFASNRFIPISFSLESSNGYQRSTLHSIFGTAPGGEAYGYLNIVSQSWASVPSPVPEPAGYGMLLAGLAMLGLLRRARR